MLFAPALVFGQGKGLDPADILKPLSEQWTSYSGDLTGKRFSHLKLVNKDTVKNLSLKWVSTNITTGCGPTGTAPVTDGRRPWRRRWSRRRRRCAAPIVVGGLGTATRTTAARRGSAAESCSWTASIYASSPDNVWAIDARDGTVLWHYYWKTRGGTSLQTRGLGMWHGYIYFELHDDWVVCLDAKNGKEVWKKEIAQLRRSSTSRPTRP